MYVHIPFCRYKCTYCSFFVLPEEHANKDLEELKANYMRHLLAEVQKNRACFPTESLKTLYIGWWTPFQLGKERLWQVLDTIFEVWWSDDLEELTIELNPDPQDEILAFIEETQRRYPQLMRIRRSFGIQTLDDEVLKGTKRGYTFGELTWFFRSLPELKYQNTIYNIDVIAFGKLDKNWLPRTRTARDFFERMVASYTFDGFSVYTLELFPGSDWYYQDRHMQVGQRIRGNDDQIVTEASWIKDVLKKSWYQRYELSNFALSGKRSLHNMVYRTWGSYLGLGMYASSYLHGQDVVSTRYDHARQEYSALPQLPKSDTYEWVRRKHTEHRKDYLAGKVLHMPSVQLLNAKEERIERVILWLRTDRGLQNYKSYADLFVDAREELLARYEEHGLVRIQEDLLLLTPAGRDVYNTLITDLMKEV